jgi:predicted CXXCH cytochrome family protein
MEPRTLTQPCIAPRPSGGWVLVGLVGLVGLLGAGCAGGSAAVSDVLPRAPSARATVEVIVVGPSAAPVPGAWVVLAPTGRDGVTDAAGTARLVAVAPGEVEITARAEGFLPSEARPLTVPESGDVTLTVQLASGDRGALRIEGRGPAAGEPVGGASITLDGVEVGVTGDDGVAWIGDRAPGEVQLAVTPPGGTTLLPFTSRVTLTAGATSPVAFTFAARTPDEAGHGGSDLCLRCHASQHDLWAGSAHGQARRSPGRLEQDGPSALTAAFAGGEVIGLGPDVPGAEVRLGRPQPGTWTAEVTLGGETTGPLRITDAYGGHQAGFAFAVDHQGTRRLLPLGWALGPAEPVLADAEPGWEVAWTDGWFPGGALATAPGPETSFDLRCAGCHAVGFAIEEGPGGWSLGPAGDSVAPERSVGCEACHGPGSSHAEAEQGRAGLIHQPGRQPAGHRVDACARCHQRMEADAHPLSAAPGLPLDGFAEPPRPWEELDEVAVPAPDTFAVGVSRVHSDQVAALQRSPHTGDRTGDCLDCHDPHGSASPASLRAPAGDDGLCVGCHRARFPDAAAIEAHGAHPAGAAVTCVDCHMAPSGLVLRRDGLTGAGETRDHGLVPWTPDDVLAVFDAAGTDALPPAELPVTACAQCHLREQERALDAGSSCSCAVGDPGLRATWETLRDEFAAWSQVSQ